MDFLKTLLAYMATTLIVAVESTSTPSVTPVPTPSPTPGPVEISAVEMITEMPVQAETATPTATVSVTPVPVPTITPNMKGYHNLIQGDRGEEVKRLQERLIELGYLPEGAADGAFGGKTRAAVRQFQYYNGLTVDGIAGRTTQTNLFENPDAARYPVQEAEESASPEPTEVAAETETNSPEPTVFTEISETVSREATKEDTAFSKLSETPATTETTSSDLPMIPAEEETVSPEPSATAETAGTASPEPSVTPETAGTASPEPSVTSKTAEPALPERTEIPEEKETISLEPEETPAKAETASPEPLAESEDKGTGVLETEDTVSGEESIETSDPAPMLPETTPVKQEKEETQATETKEPAGEDQEESSSEDTELVEDVDLDELEEMSVPVQEEDLQPIVYEDLAGFVVLNDSDTSLQWKETENGVTVGRSPRLQRMDEDFRVSLDDLCLSVENWKLADEGNSLVLEAQGFTLALLNEDAGPVATVDGIEMTIESGDFDFDEGHFIRVEFLTRALDGTWEWNEGEESLMLYIPDKSQVLHED